MARLRDSGTYQQNPHQKTGSSISKSLRSYGNEPERPKIVIKAADHSDAGFIRSLSESVFSQYGPYENLLPEWFLSGLVLTLKAVIRKTPMGFIMLGIITNDPFDKRIAELVAVAVAPDGRRMGIADRLMTAGLRMAEERFVQQVILHTGVENLAAQALFEKHGFVSSERKKGFYPNGQNALMMVKAIRTQ